MMMENYEISDRCNNDNAIDNEERETDGQTNR